MRKIRFFKCPYCDEVKEKFVEDEVRMIECECGKTANRMLSAPRCFQNTTGKSPGAKY